jgi:hypothetical protein
VTLPVYPYRCAPEGLATRNQLRAQGLRPGGNEPVAELRWRSRKARHNGGWRTAHLYDTTRAKPVRPMTPARWRAITAALRARRTCPACGHDPGYTLPTSLGTCLPCADPGATR